MKDKRVDIFTVSGDDQMALTQIQQKINQWMSTGYTVKYTIHTTATNAIYNICRYKEAG